MLGPAPRAWAQASLAVTRGRSLEHGKAISATHLLPLDRGTFEAFARKALAPL